ncbi:hypothetical protein EPUL_002329, partial [Erysiphe pulchra]
MVFRKFYLQALIFLSILGILFVSASPVSTIIELETKTVIEIVTVTVFIPFQTFPPLVDVDQHQQQLAASNEQNGTKSAQPSSDISSAQNLQNNTKTPDKLTPQDGILNNLSSPNDQEAGIAQIDPATKNNNKTIKEALENAVIPLSNEVSKVQEAVFVAPEVSKDEEVQTEIEKSPKVPPAIPEVSKAQEAAFVAPEIPEDEELEEEAGESPKIPPAVPEVPKAQEPTPVTPEIPDKEGEEAVQRPDNTQADPELFKSRAPPPLVPEVPTAQDPPETKEISAPPSSPGANGNPPSQAIPILINSPTIPNTPKTQEPQSSRESGGIKDISPKKAPQFNENTSKFLNALSDYESTALKFHNLHRTNHTSNELSWNSTLAKFALATAKTCVFEHDFSPGDGDYGQNLAAFGSSLGVKSLDKSDLLADSITNKWYNTEFRNVPFGLAKPPTSGPQFLHLTQVIWKDTRSAGNVLGQFDTEVKKPLGEGTVLTTAFD